MLTENYFEMNIHNEIYTYRLLYVLAGLTLRFPHGYYNAFIVCCVWISKQTVIFLLYIINGLVYITELESVYRAVHTDHLYNTDTFRV